MKNSILLLTLLLLGKIVFSQTLTPEICWSFDGKNTELKEIVLIEEEIKDFSEIIPNIGNLKLGRAAISQPLALIDEGQRWIIMPPKPLPWLPNEQPKHFEDVMITHFLFTLSLHDLKQEKPFQNSAEILAIDAHIWQILYGMKEESFPFERIKDIFWGYQNLSDTLSSIYPNKKERMSDFLSAYLVHEDSMEKSYQPDYSHEQMIADSIAAVAEAMAMAVADSVMMAEMMRTEYNLSQAKTKVKWKETLHDFKKIADGEVYTYIFSVKNIGKNDLYIGISEQDYPQAVRINYCQNEAIKPGKSCNIIVSFESYVWDRTGDFSVNIPVKGNFDKKMQVLTLKGTILPSQKYSPPTTYDSPSVPPQDEAQALADSLPKTQVQWVEEVYDFKQLKEGEKATHSFEVKNVGTQDLHITKVKPSCGCTATYCTKEVIKPGESCQVVVEFNSAGKSGTQQKSITVTGNFEGGTQKVLKFTGEVLPKQQSKE